MFKGNSILSSGGHLVQPSGTVWAILVYSHLRNFPVIFFQNLSAYLAEETFLYNYFKIHLLVHDKMTFKGFSIFISAAILLKGAERFEQFW